ncbi:MAG TPA: cysteine peptidase family C39 domain-containing protein [Pirellulales bacterium]|nr:cysteine peptidase family C39 domain-containing protein [Pirellulales bacterium]
MRTTLEALPARRGRRASCAAAAVLVAVLLAPANCADLKLERFYEPNRCGPIALYCVCKSYQIDTTIDELAKLAGFDGRETSVAGLVAAAEKKGLKAEALESSMAHLTTLGGPAIIDYPKGHFCAFFGWDGTSAIILDPPKKAERVGFGELRRRWGRHMITFSATDTKQQEQASALRIGPK